VVDGRQAADRQPHALDANTCGAGLERQSEVLPSRYEIDWRLACWAFLNLTFLSFLWSAIVLGAANEPTYRIAPDGRVDAGVYNGYRRYNAECIACHGPDGEGSTFGPTLVDSLQRLPYAEFRRIVTEGTAGGGNTTQHVMKGFRGNPNVMCHLDDIYVYLKARSEGALGRGRPRRAAGPGSSEASSAKC
jgi:methanol metabolism-related c-type cytochrome